MKVLTMGEIMIQFNSTITGPLRHVNYFEKHIAGSEGNVAIGVKRLGIGSAVLTAVGEDEFGKNILMILKAEGVNTSLVKIDDSHPTGIYFIQRGYPIPEHVEVIYYRKDSAFNHLTEEDIKEEFFKDVNLFHTSGISLSLSEKVRKACERALGICLDNEITVSFDTNIRRKLLKSRKEAIGKLKPFLENSRIIFTGKGDLEFIFGSEIENVEKAAEKFLKEYCKNCEILVIKMGANGSMAWNGKNWYRQSSFKVNVVDEVGAGDAFDAAFLACYLKEEDIQNCLKMGSVAGALVTTTRGDYEAFPGEEEIHAFLNGVHGKEHLR
ncbi:MAG: sugar kinase [Thermotogae bacterium]|nr:sugar kinase [Thermotogota bacterium]